MASGEGVEPNILIMFDNSLSMNEEVQAYFYSTLITYDPRPNTPPLPLVVPLENRDSVYYQNSSGGWTLFANFDRRCCLRGARTALTNSGHYEGYTNSTCKAPVAIEIPRPFGPETTEIISPQSAEANTFLN